MLQLHQQQSDTCTLMHVCIFVSWIVTNSMVMNNRIFCDLHGNRRGQEEDTHPLMEQIKNHPDQTGNCRDENVKLRVISSMQGTRQ